MGFKPRFKASDENRVAETQLGEKHRSSQQDMLCEQKYVCEQTDLDLLSLSPLPQPDKGWEHDYARTTDAESIREKKYTQPVIYYW